MSKRCKPGVQDVRCRQNKFHIFDENQVPGITPVGPTPPGPGPTPPTPPRPPPPEPLPKGRTGGSGLSPWEIAALAGGSVVSGARLAQASQMGVSTAETAAAASEIEMTAVSEEAVLSTTTGYSAISQAGLTGGESAWAGLTTEAAGEGELATLSAITEEGAAAATMVPFEIGGEALALEATGAAAATAGVGLGVGAAIALAAPLTVYALVEFSKNGLFDWYTNAHDTSGPPWVEPPPMFATPDQVMAYQMAKSESDAKYYSDLQQQHDDAFNKIVEYAKANGDPIPSNDKEANDYVAVKQEEQLKAVQSVAASNSDPVPQDPKAAADYAAAHSSSTPAPAPSTPAPSTPAPSRVDTARP